MSDEADVVDGKAPPDRATENFAEYESRRIQEMSGTVPDGAGATPPDPAPPGGGDASASENPGGQDVDPGSSKGADPPGDRQETARSKRGNLGKKLRDAHKRLKAQEAELAELRARVPADAAAPADKADPDPSPPEGEADGGADGGGASKADPADTFPDPADFDDEDGFTEAVNRWYADNPDPDDPPARSDRTADRPPGWSDDVVMTQILHEAIEDSELPEDTWEALVDLEQNRRLQLTPQMIDWLVDDESRLVVVGHFIESPRESLKVARMAAPRQAAALERLLDRIEQPDGNDGTADPPTPPPLRGANPPEPEVPDPASMDMAEYEKYRIAQMQGAGPFSP